MRLISKKNESGIALLLVISSIVLLTMLAVEFAYNAQVEYHLAFRQKEKLQAYFLANSAYQMTLLELKIGNQVQSQVASATQQANIELPVDLSAPLCEQFPIKTALFRMVLGEETGDEGRETKDEETKGEEEKEAAPQGMFSGFPLSGLEEFLQFEGDFDAECKDESSKIDLNFFYSQDPARPVPEGQDNAYDSYKKFIVNFLSQPQFQELFREKEIRIPEVVRNIADWIDPNDGINEIGRGEGGSEEGIGRVKNGKLSTQGDIFRVEGIEDSWWAPVSDYFTIYGMADERGNPQINVCRAPDEVVQALILRYLESRKDLPPLPPENAAIIQQLVGTVQEGCTGAKPDKAKMAQDLDAKLLELLKAQAQTAPPPETQGTAGYAAQTSPFADWIATQSRFYRLKLTGQVKDTLVKINAVIDLGTQGGQDPRQWKLVYWKVE